MDSLIRRAFLVAAVASLANCSDRTGDGSALTFQHAFDTGATPWTHDRFDDAEDKFSFAIFSDLNGGEREGVFQVALAQMSLLRPELIIGVGDLIDSGHVLRPCHAGDDDRDWADDRLCETQRYS